MCNSNLLGKCTYKILKKIKGMSYATIFLYKAFIFSVI